MADVTLRMFGQSEKAAASLLEQGLSRVATRPHGDKVPSLPRDITDLHDENLMNLFVELTSWVDYLSVQVSCAQVDERAAQKELDYTEAQSMVDGWTDNKNGRVAVAKAKQASDPAVREMRDDLDDKHAYRKLIETITSNLERDAALVSRELTRRTSQVTARRGAGY